uniref:Uncharacterized protein n=1 Tax=Tanacetum cinerariifolium TaxID=118510 RepID=A0A699K851_TANCI|nr:hypothetical protein [Tanacetum cinerariifolium]
MCLPKSFNIDNNTSALVCTKITKNLKASSAIFSTMASLFFWQWKLSSLAVETSSDSGNSITGSGNAFYSQQCRDCNDRSSFQDRPTPCWPQGEDIKRGIKDYFSKRYPCRLNKYKQEMLTNKGGLEAADKIRRERPENVTLDNWNKLVDSYIDPKRAHRAEVNSRNRLDNKIVSLQGSRSLA